MAYDFKVLKERLAEAEAFLMRELSGIRTGRAAPTLLDSVLVEAYGSRMPIRELGSVTIEDARMLRVSPWDATQGKAIERAITLADLGVSISSDEKGVRVSFPELTSERREALVKLANKKLEEARISVRTVRDDIWSDIQKREKEGGMSEDEKFRAKEDMQKAVDATNKKLEELFAKKEQEISS